MLNRILYNIVIARETTAGWLPITCTRPAVIVLAALLITGQAAPCAAIRLTRVKLLFQIDKGLTTPSDVAVAPKGNIYIVDGVNHAVRVYSSQGKPLFSFGSQGKGKGQFRYPLGIDIGKSGKVYIADTGNRRVQIFTADGDYRAQIVMPSDGAKPADPTDVAVDEARNRCYVVDNDNHRIVVMDLSGQPASRVYGSPGDGKGKFRYPFQIDLDAEGRLHVVDVINTRVQVMNAEGLFVAYIGGWGVDPGEFFRPKGIAVTPRNRVLVSDSYTGVIQVFDANGHFFSAIGSSDPIAVKRFKTPTGLFVDRRNRLYVVEMLANKLSVFQMEEDLP